MSRMLQGALRTIASLANAARSRSATIHPTTYRLPHRWPGHFSMRSIRTPTRVAFPFEPDTSRVSCNVRLTEGSCIRRFDR